MKLKKLEPFEIDSDGDLVINLNTDYDSTDWTKIKRLEKWASEGDLEAQETLDTYYSDRYDDEPEPRYEIVDEPPTFKIPRSVQELGVNVPPNLDPYAPTCQPGETRPGVWIYFLDPDYDDPHYDHYRDFRAECSHCFWRLGYSNGKCLAFPGGIPEDLESHLSLFPGDRGICYMGIFEASIMDVPVGLPLEQSQKLMKKVLNKRKKLTYPPRPKEFPWE